MNQGEPPTRQKRDRNSPRPAPSPTHLPAVLIVIVTGLTLAAHWPVLSANALCFDDKDYLVDNDPVQNPSWASAGRFLGEVLAPSTVGGYYQPLSMISLMLDSAMGGTPDNLRPFHRTSLALHVANTALVFLLLYLLIGNPWAAAVAGLLFGVHPMNVEPIAWIGERKTLLAAFFALCSLSAYAQYARTKSRAWYTLALVLFVPALMSKPTTTPLPLLMLLLDYWPLERLNRRAVAEKIPFFVLAGASALITYISQKSTAGIYDVGAASPLRIPLILAHNLIFYLWKMIWPVPLSAHYPFPEPMGLSQPMVLAGVIGTAVLIPLLIISLRWTRSLLIGWLIFFVAILPTMGVVGFTNAIAADRFVYLPILGVLLVVGALLAWILNGLSYRFSPHVRIGVALVFGLILCGLASVATRSYLTHWRDSESLAQHMMDQAPHNAYLHQHMANVLVVQNKVDLAIKYYTEALRLNPTLHKSHNNLGMALVDQGKRDEAIKHFNEALRLKPAFPQAHYNLGMALIDEGKIDEALIHYFKALRLMRASGEIHNHFGVALANQGRRDEAIRCFTEALRVKPAFPAAHCNLGIALAGQGQVDEAVRHFTEARRINPAFTQAHYNLGVAFASQGKSDEAIRCFNEVLRLKPDHAEAHNNLAFLLIGAGKLEEAAEHFRQALAIIPFMAPAHVGLGNVLELQGKLDEAIREYEEASRLNPQDAQLRQKLDQAMAKRAAQSR